MLESIKTFLSALSLTHSPAPTSCSQGESAQNQSKPLKCWINNCSSSPCLSLTLRRLRGEDWPLPSSDVLIISSNPSPRGRQLLISKDQCSVFPISGLINDKLCRPVYSDNHTLSSPSSSGPTWLPVQHSSFQKVLFLIVSEDTLWATWCGHWDRTRVLCENSVLFSTEPSLCALKAPSLTSHACSWVSQGWRESSG